MNKSKWSLILASTAVICIFFYLFGVFLLPDYKVGSLSLHMLPLFVLIVIGGIPLIFQIIRKIFTGDWGADLLAVIALITAVILHEYLAASLIILMLSGGQALEAIAARKASTVLTLLASRMPSIAHRKSGTVIEDIDISTIRIGDLIVVYPHEICPVDGSVSDGQGSMNEAYLTGEPYQVSKAAGAEVLSGAINGDAVLTIRAEKLPQDSRYAQIIKVMEDAEQKRPALRRLGDQMGAIFFSTCINYCISCLVYNW